MGLKNLFIYNSDTLFEIFDEIKDKIDFNIIKLDEKDVNEKELSQYNDYLIITQYKSSFKNSLVIRNLPKKFNKILEQINVEFLGNKYSSQASIIIGKYILDFNSRTVNYKNISLNLTEREMDIIKFVKNNNKVTLKQLKKKVWNYSSELETHTVETHIYRLRKKFLETFKDDEFIKHDKEGYFLN